MRGLRATVSLYLRELHKHPLLVVLETSPGKEPLGSVARAMGWWPLMFQDVLRLCEERARGSRFRRFVELRNEEDAGHHRWFLDDLQTLSLAPPNLEELFNTEFQSLRDASYALISEIHWCRFEAQLVAVLLALEPTAHAFFDVTSSAADRLCPDLPLRYFARSHLRGAREYDLVLESTEAALDRIVLGDDERAACEETLARVFRILAELFTHLANHAGERGQVMSYVRELQAATVDETTILQAENS